ncbi:hypothetical protein FEM48_Zijuj10G0103900 [Ziziphus jujuba var. spinosa]|uniref:O-fucosyltransferase family protein n=1 Tax=Ziziphus jujuba var. spinosa TaxID=714518 RepID=A0A978UMU1_ZIZJJ|nr:hypothetical protein FEM48_Zijuj10G0103900 [Ziziphus jujuba var. spinosa]
MSSMEHNKDGSKESEFEEEIEKPYSKIKFRYAKGIKAEILKDLIVRGMKAEKLKSFIHGSIKTEKLKGLDFIAKKKLARLKIWAVRATTVLLLWAIAMQLKALCQTLAPRIISNSPSFPPPRVYENNGYLMVSSNGGLNQMRTGICDMVAIARYLNVTLIVPELDNTSFWNDYSQFQDIFDVDYFIGSLRDELRILKELPPKQKKKVEFESLYSMPPISWSNMTYYYNTILPHMHALEVVHFTKSDARLANNGIPEEVQKLRCRTNYHALRFAPPIEAIAKKIVQILREKGPFLVLHLRYEMDMVAFSGCNEEKEIDSVKKRKAGLCPMTPEETALFLRALDIDSNMQVYIAAGDIYKAEKRMATLKAAFPNLVKKEMLLKPSELLPFQNHSNQMAALDYYVSIESDIFVPTYGGNMAKVVEGHRRYLGFKKTILPERKFLVELIDRYNNGKITWDEFSVAVKIIHADRMGNPIPRSVVRGKPKDEDYFYTNPQECLSPVEEEPLDDEHAFSFGD